MTLTTGSRKTGALNLATSARRSELDRLGAVVGLLAAYAFVHTALNSIYNFGLRFPWSDHYRIYRNFFSEPLGEALFGIENAHRPVIAALVRYIEMQCCAANQTLQLGIGAFLATATVGVVAWQVWRDDTLPRTARAAGVLVAAMSVFWFANARMLFHGGEAMHVYPVTLATAVACALAYRARHGRSALPIVFASLACTVATFSFGSGIASFGALLAICICLRLRWTLVAIPLVTLVACLVLYVLVLPGSSGVSNSIGLQPATTLGIMMRWLGAPWVIADDGRHVLPSQQMTSSLVIGGAGLFLYVVAAVDALRTGAALRRIRTIALGIATLGVGTAILIGITRLDLMQQHPGQVFADRYLVWSCLFWAGLALYAIPLVARSRDAYAGAAIAAVLAIGLGWAIWPMHRSAAIWSAIVYRQNSMSAIAARWNLWDERVFPNGDDATPEDVSRTLANFRDNGYNMFARTSPAWGEPVALHDAAPPAPDGSIVKITSRFHDTNGDRDVLRIEGQLTKDAKVPRDATLVIVDADGRTRGEAVFDYLPFTNDALRWNRPIKRGFDGYLVGPDASTAYRVLVIDRADGKPWYALPLRVTSTDTGS